MFRLLIKQCFMDSSGRTDPSLNASFRLTRSLSSLETGGFGLSGLLLWLGTAPAMHLALGPQALWVWIPTALVGVMLNLQVKHLGTRWPDVSGGTPNYTTRLLKHYPGLAQYVAIGYWLGWVSVPAMNAIILTDLIKTNLEPLGLVCPETALKIIFTAIPFIVAFSGTRALGILHLFFVLPAIGFLLAFCVQGCGWLTLAPNTPGLLPTEWSSLDLRDWTKWVFVAIYAVYGCETASSFVADSRRPASTLRWLSFAAWFLPIVYIGGSWVLMRLTPATGVGDSAFLNLVAAAQPFWGQKAQVLVTFLIASGCLLSSATAVSNAPRVLYQLSLDGYLAPVFGVVSRRGVLGPSLAFTGLLSVACLIWGDVTRVVMVTGTGYLSSMIGIHLGMWLRQGHPEALWPRWSLVFCIVEALVLVIGGLAWNGQDLFMGLLLPISILLLDQGLRRTAIPGLRAEWWIRRYQRRPNRQVSDLMLTQICVLILLICSALTIGWGVRALLDGIAFESNANLFVVLLLAIAFVGVAIACWTSLPQVAEVMEAQEAAEHFFNIAQDAIVVVDEAGVIQRLNPAATGLFEMKPREVLGHPLSQYLAGLAEYPQHWAIRSEQRLIQAAQTKLLDVSVSDRVNSQLREYVVILRDITERQQAEVVLRQSEAQSRQQNQALEKTLRELQRTQAQLIQTEKLSSLGQLVAGVAHEINNPVNFIHGNLRHADDYTQNLLDLIRLYQKHYPHPVSEIEAEIDTIDLEFLVEDLPKLLNSMQVGTERIQKIVLALRNFSRMDEADMKAIDIHTGLESTLMILQNRLKPKSDQFVIQIEQDYGDLPLVECYAGQLNQVFMNILTNAIDALEEYDKQHPLATREPKPSTIRIRTRMTENQQVQISIADNGPGIPLHFQSRLFDPFFTTKAIGKGTGLSLSISYGIITEKHGGNLKCISAPGEGTELVIEIPLSQTARER
uniref:ATP-binding protein n=1 Tax=Trichocoleus desertorum TaxID=1481672 RepID=UPI0025B37B72|nr:ATP-binding protein [Trichocoleus desertorum]